MIVIEKIELFNFLNYFGNHELDLDRYKGLISINGENGAGKTSLIMSVAFCLFGMIKGDKNNIYSMVNSIANANKEKMFVKVYLFDEVSGERKNFTRGVAPKGSFFEVDGKIVRLKDFNDILERFLGVLNSRVFENIFYFKQADIMSFLTNEEIRNEIFEVFLDLRIWAIIEDEVTKCYSGQKDVYSETLMRLDIAKEELEKRISELEDFDLNTLKSILVDYKNQREELIKEGTQLSTKELTIEKDDLYNKLTQMKKIEGYKQQLQDSIEKKNVYLGKIEELGKLENIDLQKCIEELGKLKSEAGTIKRIIGSIGTSKTKCPILSEQCDLLGNRRVELENKVSKLENSQIQKEKIVSKYNLLNSYRREIEDIDKNNTVLNDYISGISDELWAKRSTMRDRYFEIDKIIKDLALAQTNKKNQIQQIDTEINKVTSSIARYQTLKDKKIEIEKQIEEYQKDVQGLEVNLDFWKIIRDIFSDEGIRNFIYQNTGALLVNEWNLFLGKVLNDVSVNFVFSKDLTKKKVICNCGEQFSGGVCKKCGKSRPHETKKVFDVVLVRNGKEYTFESMSGGEKTIIATSLRFALYKLYSELFHKTLGVMFIDEIFGMLDDINMSKMIDVLNLFCQMVEVRHVFCISHVYKEQNFDHEIIIKDDTISDVI